MSIKRDTEDEKDGKSTRRLGVLAFGLSVSIIAILVVILLSSGTGAELELEGVGSWVYGGAETEFEAGSSGRAVTFGDPSEPLTVRWSGFDPGETEILFNVTVRGFHRGENAGIWSSGKEETEQVVLAEGNYTVEGTDGTAKVTWEEVFGEPRPVSVIDHPEISRGDFDSDTEEVRARSFGVGVEAAAPEQDAAAEGFSTVIANLLSTALGGESTGGTSEPPTDYGAAQMAVVVHRASGSGSQKEPQSGTQTGSGTDSGLKTPSEPDTEPVQSPTPPGSGGNSPDPVVTPVPPVEGTDTGLSGVGSFELNSEHEATEDE